jgi:zinc/manganese transport system substrate-binding protein
MKEFKLLILLIFIVIPLTGITKLKVLTTTQNLKSLVEYVGKDLVEVDSLCKGTQDPHYIEAKPSFMLKASKADLLVSIGLDLEVGWLPLIVRGARNPKIRPSQSGSFIAGQFINTLEKPVTQISRSDGDVHPDGNPHFLLDPINAIKIAEELKKKLSALDPSNALEFEKNLKIFSNDIKNKLKTWKEKISRGVKVVTYHKTLSYFYHRFGINNIAYLEPKPGIPPSAAHILGVIKLAKVNKVKKIIVENYFDPTVAKRVAKDISDLKVMTIAVSVGGGKGTSNLIELYSKLADSIGGK